MNNNTGNEQELNRCAYCRAQKPTTELQTGVLRYRCSGKLVTETRLYCDKLCAAKNQMSYEG